MNNKPKIFLAFLCLLCMLSSCVTNKQLDMLQDIPKNYPLVSPENYKIIPGDMLSIVIYAMDPETEKLFTQFVPQTSSMGSSELEVTALDVRRIREKEGTYRKKPIAVYADGTINFPYIGKVYLAGFTILEAKKIISDKLDEFAQGTSADVSLFNRYFSVLGEAGSRRIDMPTNTMTIYEALAISSSVTSNADRSKVSIIRQTHDGTEVKTFDLRSQDVVDSEYYQIQANDVIYFPQAKRKFLGTSPSFLGVFSLLTSIAGVVVFIFRVI